MSSVKSRRFDEYLTDGRFAKSYGFNNKGFIYIEDYKDKSFWTAFTKEHLKNEYEIKCATNETVTITGKRNLEKLYKKLNIDVLVAIDADYDILSPNRSVFSVDVEHNPYVLNTYGYSRESVLCHKEALKNHLDSMVFSEDIRFDITAFINKISSIIYDYLPFLLFSIESNIFILNEKEFNACIKITTEDAKNIVSGDDSKLNIIIDLLLELSKKTNYDKFEYTKFKDKINEKGFSRKTAYQFLCGHTLLDDIVEPIFKAVLKEQQEIEKLKLKDIYSESEIKSRRNQIIKHFNESCSYKTLINTYNNHIKKDIYFKMVEKTLFLNGKN